MSLAVGSIPELAYVDVFSVKTALILNIAFKCGFVEKSLLIQIKRNLGPHDRNLFVRINNENFLRGATERNTR